MRKMLELDEQMFYNLECLLDDRLFEIEKAKTDEERERAKQKFKLCFGFLQCMGFDMQIRDGRAILFNSFTEDVE